MPTQGPTETYVPTIDLSWLRQAVEQPNKEEPLDDQGKTIHPLVVGTIATSSSAVGWSPADKHFRFTPRWHEVRAPRQADEVRCGH